MKRQGASSGRKRARIPSGKAGAEGGGEGAVGRLRSRLRAGPGAGSGQWINRDFPGSTFPCSSQHPPPPPPCGILCHSGFKRVETRGLVARVARLWSQICGFESRRHHISSCDRIQVG